MPTAAAPPQDVEPHSAPLALREIDERPTWLSAAVLAGGYLLVAGTWVVFSSRIAAGRATTPQQLQRIETIKGVGFIVVTAALLWLLNYLQLSRQRRRDAEFRRMDRAMHNAERGTLVGTFASTIAHDINNGLSVAAFALEELHAETADGSPQRTHVDEARAAVMRVAEWNRRFFDLGGQRLLGELKPFDLAKTLRASADMVQRHRSVRGVRFEHELPETAPFRGSEAMLQRAVLNLLLNAAEAAGHGGQVRLSIERVEHGRYRIAVEDSGPGVPDELRERILEPFFTSKADGTGLGLASVMAAANLHHGVVAIDRSLRLGGARFLLTLP